MADFDWAVVTKAAHEWLGTTTDRADRLYMPMGTPTAILEMAAEIYDVDAVTWPVEIPTFGYAEPPVGRFVPDRSVEETVAVLNGENNERGLPFPLYADSNQRDWQFQFCGENEANERAKKLYDVATGTLRMLYVWAMIQMMSPDTTLPRFDKEWDSVMPALTKHESAYAGWMLNRPSAMRNQNQHNVGQLWIITETIRSARLLMPDRLAQIIQPVVLTGDKEQLGRRATFGPDDRVFYQHWNPATQIDLAARCRIPEAVLPRHQLGPHTTCHCLLCENGSLTETLWATVTAEAAGSRTGRLSTAKPQDQSIPRGLFPGRPLMDGGVLDLGRPLTVEQIQGMDMVTYRMYRERLIAEMRYLSQAQIESRSKARKFLDLGP